MYCKIDSYILHEIELYDFFLVLFLTLFKYFGGVLRENSDKLKVRRKWQEQDTPSEKDESFFPLPIHAAVC